MDIKSDYNKHFDVSFEKGMVGETSLNKFLIGKHEVKTDYRTKDTGNIYIETWQYNEGGRWQSGINVTTADYWVTASPNGKGIISVETELIREILRNENCTEVRQPTYNEHTNASIGRLIPLTTLLRYMELGK